MSVQELIDKHVGKENVFNGRFGTLVAKEELGTITAEELVELDRMEGSQSDQPPAKEMDSGNLKQFAIELLEMVKEEGGRIADEDYGSRNGSLLSEAKSFAIDQALEELRK